MNIEIIKKPKKENDYMLFNIKNFFISKNKIKKICKKNNYIKTKIQAFNNKNINKNLFSDFKKRPSFKNFEKINDLRGTIYTYSCEEKNDMKYERIINKIKKIVKTSSRRGLIRIADTFKDYYESNKNVSCLNLIHYYKDSMRLVFRASDIKNELYEDLITISNSFILPVYNKRIDLTIFASTCQNIEYFNETLKRIGDLK